MQSTTCGNVHTFCVIMLDKLLRFIILFDWTIFQIRKHHIFEGLMSHLLEILILNDVCFHIFHLLDVIAS